LYSASASVKNYCRPSRKVILNSFSFSCKILKKTYDSDDLLWTQQRDFELPDVNYKLHKHFFVVNCF